MHTNDRFVESTSLILSISHAIDLIDPIFLDHHQRVTFLALAIAEAMEIPPVDQQHLFIASSLHDIGSLNLTSRLATLQFDYSPVGERHAETGYYMLSFFEPFQRAATIVRYHHHPWSTHTPEMPIESAILHLADRIDIMLREYPDPMHSLSTIRERVLREAVRIFPRELCFAFADLAKREYFWFDALSQHTEFLLRQKAQPMSLEFSMEMMLQFSAMISRVIDFRSAFTANHSRGVAVVAEQLGERLGFSKHEQALLRIAGHFHDLGKLAIPITILEKPKPLEAEEYCLVQSHTYHTYRILEPLRQLQVVNQWASLHHEKLNGTGYPFHLTKDQLPLGSRILSVADVFVALTEDRPYRRGMNKTDVTQTLRQMVHDDHLDRPIVAALEQEYEPINQQRIAEQQAEMDEFHQYNATRAANA